MHIPFIIFNVICTYQSQGDIRSLVDESRVHCHGGCEFKPRHRTLFFCIYIIIYLFIDTIV